eukprot:scaffold6057_cov140-Skeletonema_dohrnii-CCMP3373.AAC.4
MSEEQGDDDDDWILLMRERECIIKINGTDRSFIHLDARPFQLLYSLSQGTWLNLDDERQMS